MNNIELPDHLKIMQIASSKWTSKPLWVAAHLGLADLLADAPKTTAVLAEEIDVHEPSLYRVLRALACVGIFSETAPRTFGLTPLAETLRSDAPVSVRDAVVFQSHPIHDLAWTEILHSVKTGKPGFDQALGMPVFKYFEQNPEFSEVFNRAMTNLARNDISSVVEKYDFTGITTLVDVGGGHGALMSAILDRYPEMQGIVFDVSHVIGGTEQALRECGHGSRCQAVAGDFFKSVPRGDAIILSHIIHDWDDERAATILENVARALPADGKVLVCDAVVPPGNEFSPAKLLDLEMLVMPGGQERTREEFERLFVRAGLRLDRVVATGSPMCVIEGSRV